jgi:prepilin-type N-terminal cleavage/methylation domain-containing protein/prepilin-type processing-associated H-X9-DG protein
MLKHLRHSRSGFTLVELLTVIGIIAALIAMLLPVLSKARVAALRLQCSSNQRQIAMAIMMYAQEHDGYAPIASYKHIGDDFNASGYYTTWYCRFSAGQYMHIKTRGQDYMPSTVAEGTSNKFDPAASFLYCSAYYLNPPKVNSEIGIGVNVRSGAYLFTASSGTTPQRRLSAVLHPTQMVMLCDVTGGYIWEKMFPNEGYPYNGKPNSASIAYRHGNASCVTFCDGHGEVFINDKPLQSNIGYQTGLHAAWLSGSIAKAYNK